MLSKIASLFGRQASRTKKPQPMRSRPTNRVQLGIEQLEGRDVPSYLTFGTAYVAGAVSAANSLSASSIYLPSYGSANGNLASKTTSSVGQATSSINYKNNFTDTVELDLQSVINTGNYTSGNARTNTTPNNNGAPGFVTVNVKGGAGDYTGRRVLVTLSGSYLSTINGNGNDFCQMSYYANGAQHNMLLGNTNVQGTNTYQSGTYSFYTTVGSSFQICETTVSSASGTNALANGTAAFTITTRSI